MISSIKVNEVIKNWEPDGFEIVQKYETVDALWGLELRKITDDDIKALKEGKYLYCDDGEYAQIISYEKSERSQPSVMQKSGKWIPCSERLPEENGQYLITVKYKPEADYEDIYAEHGEWTDGRWDMFCFGHCGEVEDIIAWMPLPEPYKSQERSNKE